MKPLKPMLVLMMCLAVVFSVALAYLLFPVLISPRPAIGTHSVGFYGGGVRVSDLIAALIIAPLVIWVVYRLSRR